MDYVLNNGRYEPCTCDCGGKMIDLGDERWRCEACGYEVYIDSDGDFVSEYYDPEFDEG